MSFNVTIHKDLRDRLLGNDIPADVLAILLRTIDDQLKSDRLNGERVGKEGEISHYINVADPDPHSDSIFKFAMLVKETTGERRITDIGYIRKGSDGPQY